MEITESFWTSYRIQVAEAAKAAAEYERLEAMTRVIKSRLMQESLEKSSAGQERDAYSSGEYVTHLGRVHDARLAMETARGELSVLRDQLEVWRTKRADRRAEINLR